AGDDCIASCLNALRRKTWLDSRPRCTIASSVRFKASRQTHVRPGCRKLTDSKNDWRVRVGDYRIVYELPMALGKYVSTECATAEKSIADVGRGYLQSKINISRD